MLPQAEGGAYAIDAGFMRDMIAWFKDGKAIPRRYVWEIVLGAYAHFEREESLVTLDVEEGMTVDVIGDVHGRCSSVGAPRSGLVVMPCSCLGQFYDYLHLLSLTGEPNEKHALLMNGDLVDRGSWSVEVILVALAFKCKCAINCTQLRHAERIAPCRALP